MSAGSLSCLLIFILLTLVWPQTVRCYLGVSLHSDGTQANSYSFNPVFSADGRSVSFYSYAKTSLLREYQVGHSISMY